MENQEAGKESIYTARQGNELSPMRTENDGSNKPERSS